MAEKFYDVPGAAQVLGLKDETMRRWLRTGKIRGLRLGRDWRISERAIDELAHVATNAPNGAKRGRPRSNPDNPMLAALALADELREVIAEGTREAGAIDIAAQVREMREERDRELSGV
jgi:excisionase family DNA binding protein